MAFRGGDRGRGRGGGSGFGRGGAYHRNPPTLSRNTNVCTLGGRGGYSNSNFGPPAAIIGKNGHRFFLEPGEFVMAVDAPAKTDPTSLTKMTANQLPTQPWNHTH